MENISRIREVVNENRITNKIKRKELKQKEIKLHKLEKSFSDHVKVREVYQQAALAIQRYIESSISSIVTNALQAVFFEKDIEFVVKFNLKRNSTECNLTILEDDDEYEILDDKGFGVADVCSFALRVAYVLLDSVDNVIILDEPLRHLDDDRMPYASKMISELSKELGMQFIIVTHSNELGNYADKTINIKYSKGSSTIIT